MNDGAEFGAKTHEVGDGELALEDGVLEVVTVAAHGLEDFAEALII